MRCKAGLFSRPFEFSPATLAGLTGWWDASDSATLFDATTGGSVVAADGGVARWQDKSGNARHFTQSDAADRPTRKAAVKNGLDVVRFDGSSDFFLLNVNLANLITASAGSVFIVAKAASVTSNEPNWWENQCVLTDTGPWQGFFALKTDDTVLSFAYDGVADPVVSLPYSPGDWIVLSTWHDGSDLRACVNQGSPASTPAASRLEISNTVSLGKTDGVTPKFFHGDVAEIIASNVALSAADRESVQSYLMDKWAIT